MRPRHITLHAIERYRERVQPLPTADIIAALDTPIIHTAIALRAHAVRIATGQRYIIKDGCIVTVAPKRERAR